MKKMILYTGTKTVKACPMTLGEAEKVLNRTIDTSAVEGRESIPGYLVEYCEDGDGYRSWSPKECFEKAYRVSETYVDRMIIERDELMKRYLAGRKFSFMMPKSTDRDLLMNQLCSMETYMYVLSERIGRAQAAEKSDKQKNSSDWVKKLVGMTVVEAGECCDKCEKGSENCKKLMLTDGSYICLK